MSDGPDTGYGEQRAVDEAARLAIPAAVEGVLQTIHDRQEGDFPALVEWFNEIGPVRYGEILRDESGVVEWYFDGLADDNAHSAVEDYPGYDREVGPAVDRVSAAYQAYVAERERKRLIVNYFPRVQFVTVGGHVIDVKLDWNEAFGAEGNVLDSDSGSVWEAYEAEQGGEGVPPTVKLATSNTVELVDSKIAALTTDVEQAIVKALGLGQPSEASTPAEDVNTMGVERLWDHVSEKAHYAAREALRGADIEVVRSLIGYGVDQEDVVSDAARDEVEWRQS